MTAREAKLAEASALLDQANALELGARAEAAALRARAAAIRAQAEAIEAAPVAVPLPGSSGDRDVLVRPLLKLSDLARRLKVSPRSLYDARKRGEVPNPDLFVGGRPRWYTETILAAERRPSS